MNNKIRKSFLFRSAIIIALASCSTAMFAGNLDSRIDSILNGKRMTVGIAAECGTFCYKRNNSIRFPMMSVFKTHVAMAVLGKMNKESVCLDSMICISKERMHSNTYSPLYNKWPGQDIRISVADLLYYSVAESDNNACDILIDMAGGVDSVDMYIRKAGINGFCISETEASMHEDVATCYNNWTHPTAMLSVLKEIYATGNSVYNELQHIMTATKTGVNKIPAGVPQGIKTGHKTGSSDRIDGVKIGDNDAGIVFLPGSECYIVVFIKDSSESDDTNAEIRQFGIRKTL